MPVRRVKKQAKEDPRLLAMVEKMRAEGKPEHHIEGAVRGWKRAAEQDRKKQGV